MGQSTTDLADDLSSVPSAADVVAQNDVLHSLTVLDIRQVCTRCACIHAGKTLKQINLATLICTNISICYHKHLYSL